MKYLNKAVIVMSFISNTFVVIKIIRLLKFIVNLETVEETY